MADKANNLVIKVNQQQLVLLERLREEGAFGDTLADVVTNVFRQYAADVAESEGGQ